MHTKSVAPQHVDRWDSMECPTRDRLAGYADKVAQSLFVSSMTPYDGTDFHARFAAVRFGTARAVRFRATPHFVRRLGREVSRTCEDIVVAGLHLSAGVKVRTPRGELVRKRGDIVSLQSSTEFCLETAAGHDFEMLSLLFDGARIDKMVGATKRDPLKLLSAQPGVAALKASVDLFGRRFAARATHEELSAIFSACEMLLATVLLEDRDYPETMTEATGLVRRGLMAAMEDYVLQNLAVPTLAASDVARAFGISTRYVQKVFADERCTFESFLLEKRLEGVRASLVGRPGCKQSIGEIAARWGFASRATFNRTFKARFHMTPAQLAGRYREG